MTTNKQDNVPKSTSEKQARKDANADPLSGVPGAHPVGAGVGAAAGGVAAGAATGAAIGTVAGPVGTVVGAMAGVVVGAVAGGLAGKAVAEGVNPTVEHGYWKLEYTKRRYYIAGTPYEQYAPAYEYGWVSWTRYHGKSFDDVEPELQRGWDKSRGASKLRWEDAREAMRDSWVRVSKSHSGK